MAWRPGQRAKQRSLETPYEDVPAHLAQPLWDWAQAGLFVEYVDGDRTPEIAMHLRIALTGDSYTQRARALAARCSANTEFLLDVVEALLELYGDDRGRANELETLLEFTNSAYRVNDARNGLVLRITPEVTDQVQAVVDAATGSPGDHLRDAWNEAYGRKPDPVKSYSESVKAVESAMAPIISPANLRATLGTMIRDVKAKESKWRFAIDDGNVGGVETVLNMMQILWDGQTSRHGGVLPTKAETPEEARAAVHLAATLVQFAVGSSFTVA